MRLYQTSLYTCFFFNDTATTEIYTLSLHDALPISTLTHCNLIGLRLFLHLSNTRQAMRSEEHTSELQSPRYLVCRLLLEKKTQLTRNWQISGRRLALPWRARRSAAALSSQPTRAHWESMSTRHTSTCSLYFFFK